MLDICSKARNYSVPHEKQVDSCKCDSTQLGIRKDKNLFSICGFLFLDYCSHRALLSREWCDVMWFGPDPSVCVLLTDLSHIEISMATGAVAVATASSQSVLQLDVWAVVACVTIWGSRQVSLTFTKVTPPPSVLCYFFFFFLSFSKPSSTPPPSQAPPSSSRRSPIRQRSLKHLGLFFKAHFTQKLQTPSQLLSSFFWLLPPILPLFQTSSHRPSYLWQRIIASIGQTQESVSGSLARLGTRLLPKSLALSLILILLLCLFLSFPNAVTLSHSCQPTLHGASLKVRGQTTLFLWHWLMKQTYKHCADTTADAHACTPASLANSAGPHFYCHHKHTKA